MKIYSPKRIEEVLSYLQEYGENCELLAGGTDLVVKMKEGKLSCEYICNLSGVAGLDTIREEGDWVHIGPLATHSQIMESTIVKAHLPILHDACRTVGSPQIRNRGTLGGNIGTASPAGDTLPVLVVLGAIVTIRSVDGSRQVPIRSFFQGPGKTVLASHEIISEIALPKMAGCQGFYRKLGSRNALAISIVGVAAIIRFPKKDRVAVEVALGSVGPTIVYKRLKDISVEGLNKESLWAYAQEVKGMVTPITDVRATAEYRREMCGNLLYEGLVKLLL